MDMHELGAPAATRVTEPVLAGTQRISPEELRERYGARGSPPSKTIRGDWEVRFTLVPATSRRLPAPSPARMGDLTFTFESVRWTPNVAELDYTIRGGNANEREIATLIWIVGAPARNGSVPAFASPLWETSTETTDGALRVRQLMAVPRPGRYRLVTATAAMASADDAPPPIAWIDVPEPSATGASSPTPTGPASAARR
jgi:hypothetical protein